MKLLSGGTSHTDFRILADSRIREARVLYRAGEFDGATYLAGYSVECALKAIITKAVPSSVLLPPKSISQLFTHNLAELARHAELIDQFTTDAPAGLAASWTIVNGWSEQRRYITGTDGTTAADLLDSIDDPKHGILPWLKQRW